MAIAKRNIVKIGDQFLTFPEGDIKFYENFPAGTYKIVYDPHTGPSIVESHDIDMKEPKLYGNAQRRVDKVISKWDKMDTSYGVIASGTKGMGKSLIVSAVAKTAMEKYGLPVFIADTAFPDIADFIESNIGEAVVIFDEFEKKFNVGEANLDQYTIEDRRRKREDGGELDRRDDQTQFLSLFDGLGSIKRLYMMTVNDISKVNNLFINRTGRFHYHFNFTYPDFDAIEEYMRDKVKDITDEQVNDIQRLSLLTKLSYDHLSAIVAELNDNNFGETIQEIVADLNIKNSEIASFGVLVNLKKGDPIRTSLYTNSVDEDGNFVFDIIGDSYVRGVDEDGDKIYERSELYIKIPSKSIDFKGKGTPFFLDEERSKIQPEDADFFDSIKSISLFPNYTTDYGTYSSYKAL